MRRPPEGAVVARVKAVHVATTHIASRNPKAHRPRHAVVANTDIGVVMGARFLCGAASSSVRAFDEIAEPLTACSECERIAGNTVYVVYGYAAADAEVLYVGQTGNLAQRHRAHSSASDWFSRATHRWVISEHLTRSEALAAEHVAIRELRPTWNRALVA